MRNEETTEGKEKVLTTEDKKLRGNYERQLYGVDDCVELERVTFDTG